MNSNLYNYLIDNNISKEEISKNEETIINIYKNFDPKLKEDLKYQRILNYLKKPSFLNIVKGLVNSSYNHLNNRFKNVSNETKSARLEICKTCEFFNPALAQCQKCGCFLNIKTSWASEKCPLDKWGEEIEIQKQEQQNSVPADCGCNKK